MKSLTIIFLAAVAFLCLFVADLHATHPVCVKQIQQVVQPVVVPQNVYVSQYYRVGEALIVPELVAELRALRAEVQALKAAPQTAPQTDTAPPPTSMISQKCASCHAGNTPDAGLYLDGKTSFSAESFREIVYRLQLPPEHPKHMPKGKTLTGAEMGAILDEALLLSAPPDLERQKLERKE